MATLTHAESRRMYSWWWDSHISPKNSKWLQENLTDMDAKVKAMIRLIEEDADSFARRAEMYYKKRPELMKLVEEFYRAYRALSERYDHATGALRQAHRTIAEVLPNQVPLLLPDDSPAGASAEAEPCTPERKPLARALFDSDELLKDTSRVPSSHAHAVNRSGALTEDSDDVPGHKGLKQLNDIFGSTEATPSLPKFGEGRARKGLHFQEAEEASVPSASATLGVLENEIQNLKEAQAKLDAEKDANLARYKQTLEKLSKLELEVSRAQEESRVLSDQATNAEAEVQTLKEALNLVESEKEAIVLKYEQCLDSIHYLESSVSCAQEDAGKFEEQANKAENESLSLKNDLSRLEAEKEALLLQHKQSLELISDLNDKLLDAKEEAAKINERVTRAETEVKNLKHALTVLTDEKDAAVLQCQKNLEKISDLESEVSRAQEAAQRLNGERDSRIAKLKDAEEQCHLLERSNQSLHSDLESLSVKMRIQHEELMEKQKEVGRLWACVQEERLRLMEADTAFQALQLMHSHSQDEVRSLTAELQNSAQNLKVIDARNQGLQDEVQKLVAENRSLIELNLSADGSIKNMQDEISRLRATRVQLQEEVGLRLDERNALQQEIYCLKEELNDLNKKLRALIEQVDSVGMNPESFGSSVKKLQDENSKLREICLTEKTEKVTLLEKLEILEEVFEKNALLEISLADLGAEVEGYREKIKALEESCQTVSGEKTALVAEKGAVESQLRIMSQTFEKLSEKNGYLENSLSDAHVELDGLREKLNILEDSHQLLDHEKSGLITERNTLASQFETTQKRLEDLENRYTCLEERHSHLENEKESVIQKLEALSVSLDAEKREHARFTQLSEIRMADLEAKIILLQEEGWTRKKELEEGLDKAANAQIEIFILQKCVQDLEEKNFSLLMDCQNFLRRSQLSENHISELQHANLEQQLEMKSQNGQIKSLRMGMSQIYQAFGINLDWRCLDTSGQDQMFLYSIMSKVEDMRNFLCRIKDENCQLVIENSVFVTLLGQLHIEAADLEREKNTIDQEFWLMTEQLSLLQNDAHKFLQMNEELTQKLKEKDEKTALLTAGMEDLHQKLLNLQGACQGLKSETFKLTEEKRSFLEKLSDTEEQKHSLEEENCAIFVEAFFLSNLSMILTNSVTEKFVEQNKLREHLDKVHGSNRALDETVGVLKGKLEMLETENFHLKDSAGKFEKELRAEKSFSDRLNIENEHKKDLLRQKEVELLEAELKLTDMLHEKAGYHRTKENLKKENDEVKVIIAEQEKQILNLAQDNDSSKKENERLLEAIGTLEADLSIMHKKHEANKIAEEELGSNLRKGRNEVELWQNEAAALFGDLQVSAVHGALFAGKIHELSEVCENIQNQSSSKDMEIELLKERVGTLEGENGKFRSRLASYIPAIVALNGCIRSLENHTLSKFHTSDSSETTVKLGSHSDDESCAKSRHDWNAMEIDGILSLQELQTRILVAEKAVIEKERVSEQEILKANAKLEAAMKQLEELQSQSSPRRENHHTAHGSPCDDLKVLKPMTEITEAGTELMTKDIMLDQMSEFSSYRISRTGTADASVQAEEFWKTNNQNDGADLTVGKAKSVTAAPTKKDHTEMVEEYVDENLASWTLVDKDLSVDKLEISRSFRAQMHQDGNKRKVLERLASDAQKLTNLEITVQDLKRKVEITEKSRKGKGVEYETVKLQLEEAEEAIQKLFDNNEKLMKNAQDNFSPPIRRSAVETQESGSVRRRRVSEQARKVSEKIGRLQLEVQKIQFMLLKLDDEKERKARIKIPERKSRVLLRDFLYGGIRTNSKQKKAHCCSCVQPPTRGD